MESSRYFGAEQFHQEAIERFPNLKAELDKDSGLIHLQMGTLARVCRQAIREGNFERVEQLFNFLGDILEMPVADAELENAVAITFMEKEEFKTLSGGGYAWELAPPVLRRTLEEQEERWRNAP